MLAVLSVTVVAAACATETSARPGTAPRPTPQPTVSRGACSSNAHSEYLEGIGEDAARIVVLYSEFAAALNPSQLATAYSASLELEAMFLRLGTHAVPSGYERLDDLMVDSSASGIVGLTMFRQAVDSGNATLLAIAEVSLANSLESIGTATDLLARTSPGQCP